MLEKVKQYSGYAGLVILAGALVHYTIVNTWETLHWGLLAAGGVLLLLGIALNLPELAVVIRQRRMLHGINFAVSIAVLLAVLVLANIVATRHNRRIDTSEEKLYSLSDQTVKILEGLKEPVYLTYYSSKASPDTTDLLTQYRQHSTQIKWEVVDPYREVERARSSGIQADHTLAVVKGDKKELVEMADESKLTSALLKVTRDTRRKIYFLTGHGEKAIGNQQDGNGYSLVAEALKKNQYETGELNLVQSPAVPDDCSVLVVAGPEKELLSQEVEKIEKYIQQGRALLVMADPAPAAALEYIMAKFGLQPGADVVLDSSTINQLMGAGAGIPVVMQYPDHPVTKGFGNRITLFPIIRSLAEVSPAPAGITAKKLLESSPSSWAETELEKSQREGMIEFNEGKDLKGPVAMGFSVEREITSPDGTKKARAIFTGDSDFAANAYFQTQMNGDLFLNIINWLAMDEELISIRPKDQTDKKIFLSEAMRRITFYFTIVLVPLITLVAGVVVRIVRRRKK